MIINHWAEMISPDYAIWVAILIKVVLVATVFMAGISVIAMFSIWWERKIAGHAQSRVGPMHVGGWHGWAQSIADGIKLILKEDLRPEGSDAFLFRLAPYLAFGPVFAAFLALPFGPQFCFEASFSIGVLYLLAVLSVEVMSTILAGWSSKSKWAIYGAMREACQMVSYEIPLGIAIICGVLVAGTLNLQELCYLQGNGIHDWFIFHNPFIFLAFLIYFVASLASSKRAPFDLPESESELVAGYHTEYSGIRFSFFFFAEYAGMFVVGGIQAILFMGGWNSPFGEIDPVYGLLGYDPIGAGVAYFDGSLNEANTFAGKAAAINAASANTSGSGSLTGWGLVLINAYGMFWFVVKAMSVIFVQIWLRWTLPRIRIDQVLYTCVKVLLPFSLVMMVGCAIWIALVPQPTGALLDKSGVSQLHWGHLLGEGWGLRLQPIMQAFLAIVGCLIALSFVVVMYPGWRGVLIKRFGVDQPPKSLFPDVMPVGHDIAFTTGETAPAEDDGEATS